MSRSVKKRIYSFSADTIPQRKRQARDLLSSLGFSVDQKTVSQNEGALFASWDPPFAEQDYQRLERLAVYATVIFAPDGECPQLGRVEVLFERGPRLHFAIPVLHQYHPIAARSELESLLPWYHKLVQDRRARLEGLKDRVESIPDPQQQNLWDGDGCE